MKGTLKIAALLGLLSSLVAHAGDNFYFMAVDETGASLPKAVLHVMTVTGAGEKDFKEQTYPADPNGVFMLPRQNLPKSAKGWAWCIDEASHDGVAQNWPDAGKLPEHSNVGLKRIKYPRHCSPANKAGYFLLNPKDAPREIYFNPASRPPPALHRSQALPGAHS